MLFIFLMSKGRMGLALEQEEWLWTRAALQQRSVSQQDDLPNYWLGFCRTRHTPPLCIFRFSHPNWFLFVDELPLMRHLLNLPFPSWFLFFLLVHFLNSTLLFRLGFLFFTIANFFLGVFLGLEVDEVTDELRVLLHKVFPSRTPTDLPWEIE